MELPRDLIQSKVNMKVERLGVRYIMDTYTHRERGLKNRFWCVNTEANAIFGMKKLEQ